MNEENFKITVDYSNTQRVMENNAALYASPTVENWNFQNSPSFNPAASARDYAVSHFAESKFFVSAFWAIGSAITIISVSVIFCVALVVKTVQSQERVSPCEAVGNKTAVYDRSWTDSSFNGVAFQDITPRLSHDNSEFESRKKINSAINKFRYDVFATESGMEKDFDYGCLPWTSENNAIDGVNNYHKASFAIYEWTKRLRCD